MHKEIREFVRQTRRAPWLTTAALDCWHCSSLPDYRRSSSTMGQVRGPVASPQGCQAPTPAADTPNPEDRAILRAQKHLIHPGSQSNANSHDPAAAMTSPEDQGCCNPAAVEPLFDVSPTCSSIATRCYDQRESAAPANCAATCDWQLPQQAELPSQGVADVISRCQHALILPNNTSRASKISSAPRPSAMTNFSCTLSRHATGAAYLQPTRACPCGSFEERSNLKPVFHWLCRACSKPRRRIEVVATIQPASLSLARSTSRKSPP